MLTAPEKEIRKIRLVAVTILRGLSLKVSDEFTVPLCAIHHNENHATGDERKWWEERKLDP
jgi:hypothetical protein